MWLIVAAVAVAILTLVGIVTLPRPAGTIVAIVGIVIVGGLLRGRVLIRRAND